MDDWVIYGLWGLFFAAFLAATILPLSSDILVTLFILQADNSIVAIFAVATLGNWAGGMFSYGMGYWANWKKIEKWLRVKASSVEPFIAKARRYGPYFALVTWLPIVGDPMAIALGIVRSPMLATAWWMLIGKGLRYAVIIYLTLQGQSWFLS